MPEKILHCSCGRVARFMIRKIKTDTWLPVCGTCDSETGIQNLVAQGCSRDEAEEINREVKKQDKAISRLKIGKAERNDIIS